ncbi:MAG: enoyl-CoA hydratase-related protein [Candidatus Promineifilaceae bacterium]
MDGKESLFATFDPESGVAALTLNRPPLNILNIAMLRQLETEIERLSTRIGVRVLVLRASGKMFSAGVDVGDHTPDKVGEMIPLFDRVCHSLAEFPTPTLAAIQGHALGGGCELVLCCDLAVMAEGSVIGQPEIQLAAMAPIAALRLPYLVGYRAAADLMFTGRNLPADEALSFGLVNAVVPAELVEGWAMEKANQIAGLSRAAMSLLKRALNLGYSNWASALPEVERLYLDELMKTADAQEGLSAFIEKRKPEWKHG